MHFRWGDVATESVQFPNKRAGAGLQKYILETKHARNTLSEVHRHTHIHFFSETARGGNSTDFSLFSKKFPNASLHLNGNWTTAIDIMSQSQAIIGGSSSFFVLGSLLCWECSVVSFAPRPKFEVSAVESLLSSHVTNLIPAMPYNVASAKQG